MRGTKINFDAINAAARASLVSLLEQWLPDGKCVGHEYKARNPLRADNKPGSFSINLHSGAWGDFATGDKGGDPISLFAYLFHHGDQGKAARELAADLGVQAPVVDGAQPQGGSARTPWVAITPVPAGAGEAPKAHVKRGLPERVWEYRNTGGELLGRVYRFRTSDGGKEVLPCVYAVNTETGAEEWRWLSFPEPRPLYGLEHWRDGVPVLIVEGEKCADAARGVLGDAFNVVTWPGGGKAAHKADWRSLAELCVLGSNPPVKVFIWPDADAQREPLSKEAKAAGADPATQLLLPAQKQPGIQAAEKIAELLQALSLAVKIVDLPAPGELPNGWDVADAIAEGWDAQRIKDFMRANLRSPAQAESAKKSPPYDTGRSDWTRELIRKPRGGLEDCRENVFLILRDHPAWQGVIGFDEFGERVIKRRDTPLGSKAGEWTTEDDYMLGLWLAQQHDMVIRAEGAIVAGVQMAANLHKFHPVREHLRALPAWDGVDRCAHWLSDCLGTVESDYARIAGTLFLISMVARVFRPGCPAQHMLVLEGAQGRGKSTALRVLGGEWFADTPFRLGDKDAFMALKGVWLYEISEMDAFNRAETTAVKAFVTIQSDHYREPYGRRMVDRLRQTVFAGTTNQGEYFKDTTGNRRSWPVRCGQFIDLDKLREWRPQLFAEALHRFEAGERWWPSREEERNYFQPQQEAREINDPWFEQVAQWVSAPERRTANEFTTMDILLEALGVKAEKVDGTRSMATRVGNIMARLGWKKRRQSSGLRLWMYVRPADVQDDEADDERLPI